MATYEMFTCRSCGTEDYPHVTIMDGGMHWGRAECSACGAFLRWLPKPDSDPTKYRRPASCRNLVSKYGDRLRRKYGNAIPAEYGRRFCEMCLRDEQQLPGRQVLDAHHIIPHCEDGADDSENVQILCTRCHKLVHWMRTYP